MSTSTLASDRTSSQTSVGTNGDPVESLYAGMPRYRFNIHGLTPLLMNQDSVTASDQIEAWRKHPANQGSAKKKKGDDRSPVWTWKTRLYIDDERRVLSMPTECIMASIRNAGAKVPGAGKSSQKSASQTAIYVTTNYCRFLIGGHEITVDQLDAIGNDLEFSDHVHRVRDLGFELNVKRIPVGASKHVRVRPMFPKWDIDGELILVDKATLPEDALRMVFQIAGARIGLCDFRPGAPKCPGRYGQYRCELRRI